MAKKRVVIAGGGFAGAKAARELANTGLFDVQLISPSNELCYYPALYRFATGHTRHQASVPLADIIGDHVMVIRDSVKTLDTARKHLTGASGAIYSYDVLILALGVVTSYFGIVGLQEFSFGIKSIDEVLKLKHHLHDELVDERHAGGTYVVVGAGPTGVELAAELRCYIDRIARWHKLDAGKITIDLVEAAPRILPRSSEKVSAMVQSQLEKLGVRVMTNQKVEGESHDALTANGQPIATHTVIWTAGVTNNPFYKENANQLKLNERGKVVVDEHLQAAQDVYVLGDNAATQYGGLAQTAISDAVFVADNLRRAEQGQPQHNYGPHQPTTVIPVGHNWAIVEKGSRHLGGILGSWMREAADLIGYADLLPMGEALKIWLADSRQEDRCEICRASRKK